MFAITKAAGDSAFERMARSHPLWSDAQIVRALCAELLADAEARPPVNVELLASLRGIARIHIVPLPWAGSLSHEDGRLIARISEDDAYPRQRFSILHETIHTFLPGFDERVQLRCKPGRARERAEVLCDIGAAELLLPRKAFADDLATAGLSLEGIETLASGYEASLEATAIRAVDLTPEPAMLLVLGTGARRRDETDLGSALTVSYAHRSGPWPGVPAGTGVGDDSPLARALEGEVVDEPWNLSELIPAFDRPVHIVARAYGRQRRVLAIITRL